MKTIMLLLVITSAGYMLKAQDKTQGKIDYEIKMNLHASLKPDQLKFKDMIPEFSTTQEILYFNGKQSKVAHIAPEDMTSDEGAKIKIKMNDDEIARYADDATGNRYKLMNKEGKKSLVLEKKKEHEKDDAEVSGSTKTKNILGFTCQELITKSNEGKMILWVTKELPFKNGPMGIYSDKGTILGVESKALTITATAINYVPVKTEEVTIPADVPITEEKK